VRYCRTELAPLRNPFSVELHRAVGRSDCDVYHLHNLWFLSTLEAAHAIPDGAPAVITIHSAEIRVNRPSVRLLNAGYKPLAQYVLDRVDHSFVQGETEKRPVLDQFDVDPASVSVVPNGIHSEEYDVRDRDVEAFREAYDPDPDVPTALYVSRLIPEKNPDGSSRRLPNDSGTNRFKRSSSERVKRRSSARLNGRRMTAFSSSRTWSSRR
jgi:glycosyltransferase involved in cell wall biosynthesis